MAHRLAAFALCVALGSACSAPEGRSCAQSSDCGAGHVCSSGYCQVAIETHVANGPALAIATSSASFDFTSTPEGASFECSLDGGAFAACPAHHVITGLADGPHTLDVRARNTDNVDATPATWAWVVDTTPPDTAIDSGPSGIVIGPVAIAFSSPEAGATFECALDQGTWAACTSPQPFATPALGNHTFQVRAKDALGNADASPAQRSWSTAADTTLTSQPANPVASSSATFTFTASDALATFECNLDGGGYAACTSPKVYAASLGDGSHTFQVRATGGGVADPTPASYTWIVDTTGPVVNLTSTPAATQSQNPSFAFSSPEAGATFECHLDSGVWAACTSPASYTVPTTLAAGAHTFYVRGVDALGNRTSPAVSYPWNQAPETTIGCAPLAATNRTTEKVTFGSTTPSATFECQLDSGGYSACTSPKGYPGLSAASHTIYVRAVASGIADPTPASAAFTVSPSQPLLYYNFEGSGTNEGALPGYAALLEGGGTSPAPPTYIGSFQYSHGLTGTSGLSFTASSSSSTGWVRIPSARTILAHDCDAADTRYTISGYYQEPASPNLSSAGFSPALLTNRGSGGGFETYHGVYVTADWTTCFDTYGPPAGTGCFAVANPGAGSSHRFSMEFSYNATTTGTDVKLYFDGTLAGTTATAPGLTILNPYQGNDLYVGKDWKGYLDALRVYNTTMNGVVP